MAVFKAKSLDFRMPLREFPSGLKGVEVTSPTSPQGWDLAHLALKGRASVPTAAVAWERGIGSPMDHLSQLGLPYPVWL